MKEHWNLDHILSVRESKEVQTVLSTSLRHKTSKTWEQSPNHIVLSAEESIQLVNCHCRLWLVETMAGRRVWGSDDSPRRDEKKEKKKASKHWNLLCVMVDSILRMSISGATIIMCFCVRLKTHHHKRPRVYSWSSSPSFCPWVRSILLQTASFIVTLHSKPLISFVF